MHFSLVLVGAHDGSKSMDLIEQCRPSGKVLLVEPVPFLFERLKGRVGHLPEVVLENVCVAAENGMVEFTAPTERAVDVLPGSDQLGSMNPAHAVSAYPQLAGHFVPLMVEARTLDSLLSDHDVTSIGALVTDTEGFDCELLAMFPFDRLLPDNIVFEFKHADGVHRVGPKLARLLDLLDAHGYHVSVLDVENMIAKRTT